MGWGVGGGGGYPRLHVPSPLICENHELYSKAMHDDCCM